MMLNFGTKVGWCSPADGDRGHILALSSADAYLPAGKVEFSILFHPFEQPGHHPPAPLRPTRRPTLVRGAYFPLPVSSTRLSNNSSRFVPSGRKAIVLTDCNNSSNR